MKILAILFLVSVACFGQPTYVSLTTSYATSGTGAPSTIPAQDTTACTPHCAIAVCISSSTASGYGSSTPPFSDSAGNTYTFANTVHEDGDVRTDLWLSVGAATSSAHSWSTISGAGNSIGVMLFDGIASGPDQQNQSSGYGSSFTTGSITPTQPNEVVPSCGGNWGAATASVSPLTLVSGQIIYNGGYSGNGGLAMGYEIQTTATTVNPTWNPYNAWAVNVASLFSTESPAPLSVTTTSLPEGFNGVPYSTQLKGTGGVQPYTWAQTSGTAISTLGLTLNTATGSISGTPTTGTISGIVFTVTDSQSTTAHNTAFALTIASTSLSITTSTCAAGTQYASYPGCTIVGTGGTVGGGYTFSIGPWAYASLPEGMVLNTSTGVISSSAIGGMGSYGVQFIVTDSLGATATKLITFAIAGSTSWMNVGGCGVFPANAIFCHRMDAASTGLLVSTSPADQVSSLETGQPIKVFFGGGTGGSGYNPNGIPVIEVPYNQTAISAVTVDTYNTCYFGVGINGVTCPSPEVDAPIPPNAPVEDSANCNADGAVNCDQHISVYQEAGGGDPPELWECWGTRPNNLTTSLPTAWTCASNALWTNTTTNAIISSTSTDISGMPLEPLLLNADEVIGTGTPTAPNGTVTHMTRFTPQNHTLHNYEWPASTATAGTGSCAGYATGTLLSQSSPPASCSNSPAVGTIWRLKASVYSNIVAGTQQPYCVHAGTCPQAAIILTGLANYGIIVADNGEGLGLIGTPDSRWVDSDLANLGGGYPSYWITESSFEPVNVSSLIVSTSSYQAGSGTGTAPTITSACPTSPATQGVFYSFTMTATGTAPITFGVLSGNLPSGLTLNGASGVISGTPAGGGTSSFTLEAIGVSPVATQPCSIQIVPVSPTISAAGGIGASGVIPWMP